MFGLSIIDTIYVIIGGGLLFALYHLIKSDERWFQVRMGGLIFVGLLVLVPLLLMRCNPDILMGENVGVTSVQAEENVFEMEGYTKKKLHDGTFEVRFNLIPSGMQIIPEFKVACVMKNDAKIISFDIKEDIVDLLWDVKTMDDRTAVMRETYDMEPQKLEVILITDKDPEEPDCSFYAPKKRSGEGVEKT